MTRRPIKEWKELSQAGKDDYVFLGGAVLVLIVVLIATIFFDLIPLQ